MRLEVTQEGLDVAEAMRIQPKEDGVAPRLVPKDFMLWGPATELRGEHALPAGDRQALAERGRPLLHLHLTDRAAGLDQLLRALT